MAESLFSELQRRNVVRVAVAYIVASWVIIEVLSLILEIYEAPAWVMQFVVAVIAIGLPFTLIFAWAFEITPEGIKRESEVIREESIVHITAKRLDYLTIFLVIIALVVIISDRFLFDHLSSDAVSVDTSQQDFSTFKPEDPSTVPVIAILPFDAIGSENQDYFTSGLHEDLLARLAKLNAFKVISRTSMREYSNTTKNMRQIGKELGADYILEGGVQTLGDRIKITAQLIRASSDEHIWAEIYNRKLTATDIFEIQAELSVSITKEMKQTLSPRDREVVSLIPTRSLEAYSLYLRSLDLFDQGEPGTESYQALKKAVQIDPNFAKAWALLSESYSLSYRDDSKPEYKEAALNALAKARALQIDLYEAEIAWSVYLYYVQRDYEQAIEALEALGRTYSLNAMALQTKAYLYRRIGNFNLAYQTMLLAQQLNPRSVSHASGLIELAYMNDDCANAARHMEQAAQLAPTSVAVLFRSIKYESECTGSFEKIERLFDRYEDKYEDRTALFTYEFRLSLRQRDYIKSLKLIEQAQSNVKDIYGRLRLQWYSAIVAKYSNDKKVLENILDKMEMNLEKLDSSNESSRMYAYYNAAYSAFKQNKEETRYWAKEYQNRIRANFKGDKFRGAESWYYVARFYAIGGLHKEAIEALRNMFEQPGGFGFIFIEKFAYFEALKEHPEFIELKEKYRHKRCSVDC